MPQLVSARLGSSHHSDARAKELASASLAILKISRMERIKNQNSHILMQNSTMYTHTTKT